VRGVPARQVKTLDNTTANSANARLYVLNAENYARGIERLPVEMGQEILADL